MVGVTITEHKLIYSGLLTEDKGKAPLSSAIKNLLS